MYDKHELLKVAQRRSLTVKHKSCKWVDIFFPTNSSAQLFSCDICGGNLCQHRAPPTHLAEPFLLVNIKNNNNNKDIRAQHDPKS